MPIDAERTDTRTNDGACDAAGRLWVGTMALDERSPLGGLYRVDADLSVTTVLTGTTISNGLGWSPAGESFYFIDSPTRRVDVFDFDPETGALENRRRFAAVEVEGAVPDGLAVDAEGGVWVALHGGWGLRRYAPDGELAAVVDLAGRARHELLLRRRRPARPVRDHAAGRPRAPASSRSSRSPARSCAWTPAWPDCPLTRSPAERGRAR